MRQRKITKVSRHQTHRTVYGRRVVNTPNGKLVCVRRMPVNQTLIWIGPIFILRQPCVQYISNTHVVDRIRMYAP